jgi:molecular chaperone HscA
LSEDEMAKMLYDSMENAADDMQRRILTEARVDARRVLAAVASALAADGDLLEPGESASIAKAMTVVERAIAGDDRDAIVSAIEALEKASLGFAERRMDRGIRAALRGHDLRDFEETAPAASESDH